MKKLIAATLALALLLSLCGCGGKAAETKAAEEATSEPKGSATAVYRVEYEDTERYGTYGYREEEYEARKQCPPLKFVEKVRDFSTQSVTEVLRNAEGELSFSPFALYCALALMATGAEGQTQAELLNALGVESVEELAELGELYQNNYHHNSTQKLWPANSLWLSDETAGYSADFVESAKALYASLYTADMADGGTQKAMSDWLSESTAGVHTEAAAPDAAQSLNLLGTCSLMDEWYAGISPEDTYPGTFHGADGDVEAGFMRLTIQAGAVTHGDGFTGMCVNTKGGCYVILLMPDEGQTIAGLLKDRDIAELLATRPMEQKPRLPETACVPVFSVSSGCELTETLKSMGVETAFSENADFSGVSETPLRLGQVAQRGGVSVDEYGLYSDSYEDTGMSARVCKFGVTDVVFDRPFVYMVYQEPRERVIYYEVGICNNVPEYAPKALPGSAEVATPDVPVPAVEVQYPGIGADGAPIQQKPGTVTGGFDAALRDFSYTTADGLLSGTVNQCCSPISLYYALSMAALGAEGQTQAELLALLRVESLEALRQNAGAIFRQLYKEDDGFSTLTLANSVWLSEALQYKESYTADAAKSLYAEAYSVDFTDAAAGRGMSQWIAKNTGGLLAPQLQMSPTTLLALINTVYLHDEWDSRFNEAETKPDTFHTLGGDVTADFMHMDKSGGVFIGEGFARAELPMKNGSVTFILPDEGVSASELLREKGLTELTEGGTIEGCPLAWSVPKFGFATSYDQLSDYLVERGIPTAFSGGADFSGISDGQLTLSEVIQETQVAIDEKGVTAAAFTLIVAYTGEGASELYEMKLDRPFIFVINGGADELPLFVGVCADPSQS